uniref:Uncharacterized protein K02A2.6-like n=1 Tax=Saccoglossus kowalevskii TaxID=10224 RepID=A0ABM0MF98_SACKO|nr:PREDICTED: uncharacterized protein K02A2.6-like [Saccoglossus kowalevskii]
MPWLSILVMVVKPGKMRICTDPCVLNRALKRSHYLLPTIEDVLPDCKVFSVLNAKNWFWHVELNIESSYLTNLNTPFGSFCWLYMPFRISTAPKEYQCRLDQAIEGLPGIKSLVDDISIYGEGAPFEEATADHDQKS